MEPDASFNDGDETNTPEIPAEITLDVAEKFRPSGTEVSESWRETLQQVRQRCLESADNHIELKCVLTHSVVPQWPSRPDGPHPPEVDGMEPIAMGVGPSRWPQQLFRRTENNVEAIVSDLAPTSNHSYRLKMLDIASKLQLGGAQYVPLVADKPVYNVTGKPVLYSDRRAVAMRRGVDRNYFIHAGGAAHERIKSITSFFSIAEQAGQCLYGLPDHVNRILWRQWPDGFRSIGDKGMWISALFELAWQPDARVPLVAERFSWDETTNTLLDEFPQQQNVNGDSLSDEFDDILSGDVPDEPAYWYSVLNELFAASVTAVDRLLAIDDGRQS